MGLEFRVPGVEFWVCDLAFRSQDLGLGLQISGLRFRAKDSGLRIHGSELRGDGSGSEFKISGSKTLWRQISDWTNHRLTEFVTIESDNARLWT